jgi:hypothetical protein
MGPKKERTNVAPEVAAFPVKMTLPVLTALDQSETEIVWAVAVKARAQTRSVQRTKRIPERQEDLIGSLLAQKCMCYGWFCRNY